jgi:hypothetical protein
MGMRIFLKTHSFEGKKREINIKSHGNMAECRPV